MKARQRGLPEAVLGSIRLAVLLAVVMLGMVAGCEGENGNGQTIQGSGDLKTEQMKLSDFARIEAGTSFSVDVVWSDSYSVAVTADDNLIEHVEVSRSGETLRLGLESGSYSFTSLRADITMPDLHEVTLSGSTRCAVEGFSFAHEFTADLSGSSFVAMQNVRSGDIDFRISGSSKVSGDIHAGDADFDVSGSSTVELEGSAGDLVVEASGSSRVRLAAFAVRNADVILRAASSGAVNLDGRLDADLSGSSHLSYIGEPTMGDVNTSSGSTLSRQD
jgi:hypothetical protein